MILGLFTAVYILGGPTPDVQIINQEFSPLTQCQQQADLMNKSAAPGGFTQDGKPILMTVYKCQPVAQADIEDALKQLKSAG